MPKRNKTTPPKRYEPNLACTNKRRFSTPEKADSAIEDSRLIKPNLSLGRYKCPACLGWHLTRQRD